MAKKSQNIIMKFCAMEMFIGFQVKMVRRIRTLLGVEMQQMVKLSILEELIIKDPLLRAKFSLVIILCTFLLEDKKLPLETMRF